MRDFGSQSNQQNRGLNIRSKCKEVRDILNKITPSTFEDLKNEFISLKLYEDESTLPMIVDLIFDKIVTKPKFLVNLYSTLCKVQTEEEQKVQNSTRPFRQAMIKKCQVAFERATNNSTEAIESTKKEIDEEAMKEEKDKKKLKELQERLEELQGKEKRLMFGTIRQLVDAVR
uniref:MIF4G domain-containing protein n=1 Tax=Acrobeloides nanus TaxID=290746 RepID=A0A914CEK5_9BILA